MKQSYLSTAFAIFSTVASVSLKQLPTDSGEVASGSAENAAPAPELKPIPGTAVEAQSLQPLSSISASKDAASFLPPLASATTPPLQRFSTTQATPNGLLGASAVPAASVSSTNLQGFKTIVTGLGPDAGTTAAAVASQAPLTVSAAPAASSAPPRLSAAPAASSASARASAAPAASLAPPLVSAAPAAAASSSAAASLKPLPGSAAAAAATATSLAPLLSASAGTGLPLATTARGGLNATAGGGGFAQATGAFNSVSPPASSPAIVRSVAAAGLQLPLAPLAGLVGLATFALLQ